MTAGTQKLNAIDQTLLAMHDVLRSFGAGGFPAQLHVWLKSRADAQALKGALARLAQHHPVLAARLDDSDGPRQARWRFRPGGVCPLDELVLTSSDDSAVLRHAAEQMARPADVRSEDPIRFQLIHLPDGRDLFLVQYDHALMDANAMWPLLAEIERFTSAPPGEDIPAKTHDAVRRYLDRHSRWRQWLGVYRTLAVRSELLRSRAMTLGVEEAVEGSPMTPRVVLRRLSVDQTDRLAARVAQIGFPSLSTAILGSAFRAVGRLTRQRDARNVRLMSNVGINLRPHRARSNLFSNQASLMALSAWPDELQDWERLVDALNRQMFERLAQGVDVGCLAIASLTAPWLRFLKGPMRRMMRRQQTLTYGFFRVPVSTEDHLAGAPIEALCQTVISWPPFGLSLMANTCHGRLILAATHVRECIDDALMDDFLDAVVQDLCREADRVPVGHAAALPVPF